MAFIKGLLAINQAEIIHRARPGGMSNDGKFMRKKVRQELVQALAARDF
jgi:hypothetical protein